MRLLKPLVHRPQHCSASVISTGLFSPVSGWPSVLPTLLGGQLQEGAGMTTGVSTGLRARGGPRLTSPLGGRLQEGAGMTTGVSTGLRARGGPRLTSPLGGQLQE